MVSNIEESAKTAISVCRRLTTIKEHCLEFKDASITNNEVLLQKFQSFCKESHVFQTVCEASYQPGRWPVGQDFVAVMQQAHDIVAAASLWMERTADARDTCKQGGGGKDGRRLNDKRRLDDYAMQDVADTCTDLDQNLQDCTKTIEGEQEEALKTAKTNEGPSKEDKVNQRIIQDDVAAQLKVSKDTAFKKVRKIKDEFDDLMSLISERYDEIPKGCNDVIVAARAPCQKLPAQWERIDKTLTDSNYLVDSMQQWINDAKGACKGWEDDFNECVTVLHASQEGPTFDDVASAQTLRLEGMAQPVLRSIQMGLLLTCAFVYLSNKKANRLLVAAFYTSQAALLYFVIVSFVQGCTTVALGFILLVLASIHRYRKIMPSQKFVSLALESAASALEGTLGRNAWIAMILTLLLQGIVLLLSLGAALDLQGNGWPLIPAMFLPLIAGVWISEIIACVFRSVIGSAVFLKVIHNGEVDTAVPAVKSAFGGNNGLGGIAIWAFASALPLKCTFAVTAIDSLEIMLPQQGESGLGNSQSFSEALRIIRLALASVLSIVALGAPTGSASTAIVAMTAMVMGHAFAAVPVYSLEASLFGFAAAVEEVGSEQMKTNYLEELLCQVVIKRTKSRNLRNIELLSF